MLNELEEFLRKAAQRALEAQQKQLAQQQGQQPQGQRPPPQQLAPRPTPARLVPQGEIVEAELIEQPNRVSQSVSQHMQSSKQFGQHAAQLGEKVGLADDTLDARLHQTFDHKLGRLTQSGGNTLPEAAPENTDTLAASSTRAMHPIAQLFGNALSIRNAVMLREILDRPIDRWED